MVLLMGYREGRQSKEVGCIQVYMHVHVFTCMHVHVHVHTEYLKCIVVFHMSHLQATHSLSFSLWQFLE